MNSCGLKQAVNRVSIFAYIPIILLCKTKSILATTNINSDFGIYIVL